MDRTIEALLTARHAITNALVAYCHAVDSHDTHAVGDLLADTTLTFRDRQLAGRDSIVEHYAAALAAREPTRHTVTAVLVDVDATDAGGEPAEPSEDRAQYRATYQRWSLAGEQPTCQAIGTYSGQFTAAPAGWTWTRHEISTEPAHQTGEAHRPEGVS